LPIAAAGLDENAGDPVETEGKGLTSDTTNLPNLVAGIDIAPTILDHLGLTIPDAMTGKPFRAEGKRQPEELTPFRDRLDELGPRRNAALAFVFVGWLILYLAAGAIAGREKVSRRVRRIGGPPGPRIPARIPAPAPPGPLVLGSHLITRSILGPNPGYGSRFYGIGNELKPALMVLLLAGLGAALTGRPKSRKNALIVLGFGLALGMVLGSGRLGAGVGAAIIVASATAVAALMMLPGKLTWRRGAILVAAPVIGLALLAVLDLATAGGQGHYSSVLSGGESGFLDDVRRRTTLAWQQLWNGDMPVVTLTCLLAAAYAIRNREMFKPWAGPIWPAALVGGLAGGLVGSFTEDSGPLLIVVATITLTGVCSYLLGRPDSPRLRSEESPQRQE